MKNVFFWILIMLLTVACRSEDKGSLVYKSTYSLQLKDLDKKRALLQAAIAFENKSGNKDYKLKDINLDVLIDGIDAGTYYSRQPMDFRASSQLKVSVEHSINSSRIWHNDGAISSSSVVQIRGTATFVDIHGSESIVSVRHKETVRPIAPKKEKRLNKKNQRKEQRELKKLQKKQKKAEQKSDKK